MSVAPPHGGVVFFFGNNRRLQSEEKTETDRLLTELGYAGIIKTEALQKTHTR